MIFDVDLCYKLYGEIRFGSYQSTANPTLHETHVEFNIFSETIIERINL
jgi:hypothetical protein